MWNRAAASTFRVPAVEGGSRTVKKVLLIAGTRPEAIKLAPVYRALRGRCDVFETRLCVSGQHREMLQQALGDFGIVPDEDLAAMTASQSLAGLSARLFSELDALLARRRPDWLIVQGDTTTTMVAALCAFYRGIGVGHVEAGLRSFNRHAPFPEEINRRVAGLASDLHFAPTVRARENLLAEGVGEQDVLVTGNTVIDALLWTAEEVARHRPPLPHRAETALGDGRPVVMVTAHRRESFGTGFEGICRGIARLVERNPDVRIIYPVHLNPRVRQPVHELLGEEDSIILIEPLGYKAFVRLMSEATVVLTDSGGIQEEAPSLGKPVVVLRDVTERPEGVEAGTAQLVGTDPDAIVTAVERLLNDIAYYRQVVRRRNPYGDGRAAERIADALVQRDGVRSSGADDVHVDAPSNSV